MAYVSKTWVDRDSQYPTRRVLVHADLSEEQVTVRRDEGIITTQGDVFDANTMNNLEARIAAGIGEKQNTLTAGSGISIENDVISATGGGGGSSTLDGLDDVNISSPTNGQALVYDSASSKWVNANGGSGSATLAGLTDVTLTTPTADQVLKYDGTKWVNGEGGGDVELSKTVSGSVCSFSDGADGLPVKDLVAQVVAVQSGTGDPSPNNIRPISGWANVGVTRAGANLINWKVSSTATTFYLPAGNYYFSTNGTFSSGLWYFRGYDADGNLYTSKDALGLSNAWTHSNTSHWNYAANSVTGFAFTVPSGCSSLEIFKQDADGTVSAMVNVGTTATSYEPYTGTTVTIALGQTVFGGELDVTSGVLKITNKKVVFDGSETGWDWYGSYQQLSLPLDDIAKYIANQVTYICDTLKPVANNDRAGNYGNYSSLVSSGASVALSVPANSKADALTWLSTHNVTFVYELAQPITVQQSGTEVETLLGINNIWADTGDTTVTYYTSSAEDVVDLVQYDTTKQDKLTAGTGISIDSNNVISATGGGGGAVIDDTTTSTTSVWSSSKTSSEIGATAAQILVPEFSASKSYRDDDLCLHDGKFYMAITDISAGAWDATKWAEQTLHDVLEFYSEAAVAWADIDDLGNVQVDNLANGQVLKYNSTTQRWENANESGGGASALNDLSDVSVPSPTAGQVLTYQIVASVGQWVASTPPVPWFELTGTIPAAQDPTNPDTVSLAFRDSRITANSTVDVYTSVRGKNYVSLLITTGSISISYVTGQSSFEVKVRVS